MSREKGLLTRRWTDVGREREGLEAEKIV